MWRHVARFVGAFLAALGVTLAAAFVVPASPLYMPATDCRPDSARYESLAFGASYDEAARLLGCPGIKATEQDLSGIVKIITFVWRTDSWPVGILRLSFYNDTLQANSATRLDLRLSLPN